MEFDYFAEKGLQLGVPKGTPARKFDEPTSHGLSHTMKAVDFIIEEPDRILFVEFKDPDHPMAKVEAIKKFENDFKSGTLQNKLKWKYRDSYLYELAFNRIKKPVYYYVLIASAKLSEPELDLQRDKLIEQLPMGHPTHTWPKPFVAGCAVFNLSTWNRLIPNYPVSRI